MSNQQYGGRFDLFGPRGELRDFVPRPGDPTVAEQVQTRPGAARKWASRVLLRNPLPGVVPVPPQFRSAATIVETGDLGRTYQLAVQMRFVLPDAQGNPSGAFSPLYPTSFVAGTLGITVRRGTHPDAPVASDNYGIGSSPFGVTAGDCIPFDILPARQLGIDLRLSQTGGVSAGVWVETLVTIVEELATKNQIIGWARSEQSFVAVNVAGATFLPARNRRTQFMVCNTSTDSDLYVCFNNAPSTATASFVLPKNTFGVYTSPMGGYNGAVSGIWVGAGAVGGALVTEGSYF